MLTEHRRIDSDIAHRHLASLDQPGTPQIFVCKPEAIGARGPVRHICGAFVSVLSLLQAAQHAGNGVFVTVNAMSGRRRLKSMVARVRALWIERDGPGPALPLTPSLVVETSPGKQHEYLLVTPDDLLDTDEAACINRAIARTCGGDRQATDMARALRLAGTWHLKGEPHLVHLSQYSDTRYAADVLRAAFPLPLPDPAPQLSSIPIKRSGRYLSAAVGGICAELAQAIEGTRNATLNRAAFRLGMLGLLPEEIEGLLSPIAQSIGLTETETAATIRSGALAGSKHASS